MYISEDGSSYKDDGTIIHFSIPRFLSDIINGDCCFICGRTRTDTLFNDEHIIPDWILRRFSLHDQTITLPNNRPIKYSQYKVPCCQSCNTLMSEIFETPISNAINLGYEEFASYLSNEDFLIKVFVWLSLIFFKAHFKDKALRLYPDLRMPDVRLADQYNWKALHHIHCVARSFLAGASIDIDVRGSFFLLPGKCSSKIEAFDYGDIYYGQSILLKLGECALLAVLDDSGAVSRFRVGKENNFSGRPTLDMINKPLSNLQLREILAEIAYINMRINDRSAFHTLIDPDTEQVILTATTPEGYHLLSGNPETFGYLMYSTCHNVIDALSEPERSEVKKQILTGNYSLLWGPSGEQIECEF